MRAYSDLYVLDAQRRLGAMLDFAINGCHLKIGDFYKSFLDSNLAQSFDSGEPAIIVGYSGIELALMVLGKTDAATNKKAHEFAPIGGATPEYWTGWALAYYQWESGNTLRGINELVSIEKVLELYHPFHEMDITSFCDQMDILCKQAHPESALKTRRLAAGLSQSQLAEATGISVRTLQQYEQRRKDINKAQVNYVLKIARVLHCNIEDLLEYTSKPHYEIQYAYIELEQNT